MLRSWPTKCAHFVNPGISVLTFEWAHLSRISDFNFVDSQDHMLAVLWCQSQIALTALGDGGPKYTLDWLLFLAFNLLGR